VKRQHAIQHALVEAPHLAVRTVRIQASIDRSPRSCNTVTHDRGSSNRMRGTGTPTRARNRVWPAYNVFSSRAGS
jgi:hypothetical protein